MISAKPYRLIKLLSIIFCGFIFISNLIIIGQFLDGITYAAISHNLSMGLGSMFNLHYNSILYPQFFEHPPIYFWIQSQFYCLLGNYSFVDKIPGIIYFLCSSYLISRIYKRRFATSITIWLAALLSLPFFTYIWVFKNNMLESLMIPLILCAYGVACSTSLSIFKKAFIHAILLVLLLGIKGPVGLFILCFFPIMHIYNNNNISITSSIMKYYTMLVLVFFILLTIAYSNPAISNYVNKYIDVQVLKSLRGERETGSRLIYIIELLYALIPLLLLYIVTIFKSLRINYREIAPEMLFILFFSIAILISPKQNTYYIAPVLPFFIIISIRWFSVFIDQFAIKDISLKQLQLGIVAYFIMQSVVCYTLFTKSYSRYPLYQQLSDKLNNEYIAFTIEPTLRHNWVLMAVLSRNNCTQVQPNAAYQLVKNNTIQKIDTKGTISLGNQFFLIPIQPN